MDKKYWKDLKDFYETEYIGIVAQDEDEVFAREMEAGGASILKDGGRRFDPRVVYKWIEDTQQESSDAAFEEYKDGGVRPDKEFSKVTKKYPHLFDKSVNADEVASYFMWQDIEMFKQKVKDGDKEYTEFAVDLEWQEMIEEIPDVKDIFMF